jgi:drug/metabolite transporter (DMT)-like permease
MLGPVPLGLALMAASALSYSVMSLLVKFAGQLGIPSLQSVFARSLILCIGAWTHLQYLDVDPWGNNKRLLLARAGVGFVALNCFYWALTVLPLADATVIQYTNPIWTALLAVPILKERITGIDVVGLVAGLIGVVLVTEPGFLFGGTSRLPLFAVGIALLGSVMSATAYTLVRRLRETEHPLVVIFYFSLLATIASMPLAWPVAVMPPFSGWAALAGIGVTTYLAQWAMTTGLHLEKAGRATAMTYLQVAFAFGWGVVLFGEHPTAMSMVGAVLVVGTSLLITWYRQRQVAE